MARYLFNRNITFDAGFPSRRVSDDQIMLEEAWRSRQRIREQQRRNRASSCPVVESSSRVGRRLSDRGSRFAEVVIDSCSADRANRSCANDNIPKTFTSFKRTKTERTLKGRSLDDMTKPPDEILHYITKLLKRMKRHAIRKYNAMHPNRPWQECRGPSSDRAIFCSWAKTLAQLNRLVDELDQELLDEVRRMHVATIETQPKKRNRSKSTARN